MEYRNYLKQLCINVASASIVLGGIVGTAILIFGGFSMNVDGSLELGRFDGLWLIIGLPVVALLVFAALSPLSYFLHKLMTKNRRGDS